MATATTCAKQAMRALTRVIGQQRRSLMSGVDGAQTSSSAERMAAMLSGPEHSILKPAAEAPATEVSSGVSAKVSLVMPQPARWRREPKTSCIASAHRLQTAPLSQKSAQLAALTQVPASAAHVGGGSLARDGTVRRRTLSLMTCRLWPELSAITQRHAQRTCWHGRGPRCWLAQGELELIATRHTHIRQRPIETMPHVR